jgi:hypothetical protein
LKNNPLNKIIFYDDDREFYRLTRVFLNIPFEYGGMGTVIGKKYEAIKDFLKWSKFDLKKWVPVVVSMGNIWANNIKK